MKHTGRWTRSLFLAFVSVWACATAAAQAGWNVYNNQRFGFHVSYPERLLRPLPESGSGDGREFRATQGGLRVLAYGGLVMDESSDPLGDQLKDQLESCAGGAAPYRLKRPSFQVVSCVQKDGKVLYAKAVRKKDGIATLKATYPQAEKATWDKVVAEMAASFDTFGPPY